VNNASQCSYSHRSYGRFCVLPFGKFLLACSTV
jgi:hypothetical protein